MFIGVIYGLLAACCWGASDFLGTLVVRRIGVLQTLFYMQLLSILVLGAFLLIFSTVPVVAADIWALAVGISFINTIGGMLLYRSFAIGTLAIVAPVASSFAVFTMVLALLFSGERPALLALGGALLVVFGVILVSIPSSDSQATGRIVLAGVPEALGVVVCFGIYFWSIEFVTPLTGVFWPVLLVSITDLLAVLVLFFSWSMPPVSVPRPLWLPVIGAALFSSMAFIAFNLGVTFADTAIVTPLSSLASGVTVLLAWLVLRDRLTLWQWGGVVIIIIGVLLVSL